MNLVRLVIKNIAGSGFRSTVIILGAALVASFAVVSTLLVQGAEVSLQHSLRRLGADIVVFPWGTRLEEVEGGHLMKTTTSGWIPRSYVQCIAAIPGVEAVSAQLFIVTVKQSCYCAKPEMYVLAIDPASDFLLESWIEPSRLRGMRAGEAIVGSSILDPEGAGISVDGYPLRIVGRLTVTGTDLDQAVFVSFDTAQDMARHAQRNPKSVFKIAPQSVTTALVRVKSGTTARAVAIQISERVPGVIPIENAGMFQAQRNQILGLLAAVLGLMAVIWLLSLLFIGLVFSITVNARKREIGVLQALGAPKSFIFRSLIAEGAMLGLSGGGTGMTLAIIAAYFLQDYIRGSMQVPFVFPDTSSILILALGGLILAVFSVIVAVFVPALRIIAQDPAEAMRE